MTRAACYRIEKRGHVLEGALARVLLLIPFQGTQHSSQHPPPAIFGFFCLGARLRGRTTTQRSKKGSEKVLGRVLGKGSQKGSEKRACYGFYSKRVLRRVLRRGSEKGVSRRCPERPLVEYPPSSVRPTRFSISDAAFLLTVGSFLLTVELFYLRLTILAFFTYNWSFFAYSLSFLTYNSSSFAYNGKVRLIRALRDCKQRSLTVSKKASTVSKKASPFLYSVAGRPGRCKSRGYHSQLAIDNSINDLGVPLVLAISPDLVDVPAEVRCRDI